MALDQRKGSRSRPSGRGRGKMAASAGCLNREPPCRAAGGTLATAPGRKNEQGGRRCSLPDTLLRFDRMRDAVAPNIPLGELRWGSAECEAPKRSGCRLVADTDRDSIRILTPPPWSRTELGRCQAGNADDDIPLRLRVPYIICGARDPQPAGFQGGGKPRHDAGPVSNQDWRGDLRQQTAEYPLSVLCTGDARPVPQVIAHRSGEANHAGFLDVVKVLLNEAGRKTVGASPGMGRSAPGIL